MSTEEVTRWWRTTNTGKDWVKPCSEPTGQGDTHSGRISLCSAKMHNSVPKAAGFGGKKDTTREMPPRGSASLGGTGALRKFVYRSGREERVQTIRQFMYNWKTAIYSSKGVDNIQQTKSHKQLQRKISVSYGKTVSYQDTRVRASWCLPKQLLRWHQTSKLLFIWHYLPCLWRYFVNKSYLITPQQATAPHSIMSCPPQGTPHHTQLIPLPPSWHLMHLGGGWTSTPSCL